MDIFIYTYSPLSTPRDVLEEMLEDVLGGEGEITGAGSGKTGSNIDIEIYQKDAIEFLGPIRKVLQEAGVPASTVIVIEDQQFKVYN